MPQIGVTYSTGQPSTVGVLVLDALLTEGTTLRAKASEYAVEEGSPISDHVMVESERLKLSGMITPTDLVEMTATGRPKLLEAKATLRKMINDRAEVTISTGMDTYTGMILESGDIGRNNEGEHLSVDLEFVKIRKVRLRKAAIPADKVSGKAKGKAGDTKTKAGKSAGTEPTGPEKSKLARVFDKQ